MKLYIDTETGAVISETELQAEFAAIQAEQPGEYNYSFSAYVRNCTDKNGFLKEV